MLKLLAAPLVVAAVLVGIGYLRADTTQVAHAQTTDFSIDVDTGNGGVQNVINVAVGASLHVQVNLDSLSPADYIGYQAKMYYDDVVLDAGGFPASWNAAPTATTGGNVLVLPTGPDCSPTPASNSLQDNDVLGMTVEDDLGINSLFMFCLDNTLTPLSTLGALVDFYFTCDVAGSASLTLADQATDPQGGTQVLDGAFTAFGDNYAGATINCQEATATNTPEPPTATFTPTATNTAVPGTRIEKVPEGNGNNVDLSDPNLPLANLWLCENGLCDGPGEGELTFAEMAFLSDPTARFGAFEFQIKFDHKIFDINLDGPSNTWDIQLAMPPLGNDGRTWDIDTMCFRNITENYINFACTSTGPSNTGFTGVQQIPIAYVTLHPDSDLKFRIRPGNDNGVVRVVLDENCELVDIFGHPLPGAIAGGLTPVCGDLAVTVRILEGDLNLDCEVNTQDAQLIAQKYGMVFGLHLYDPWFDLEPNITDFDIDVKDLQKVFGRLDSDCQTPFPAQPPVGPPQS